MSETKLDYYHQKKHVQVVPLITEQLKTFDRRKLGNFKKISEMLELMASVQPAKRRFLSFTRKNCKKSSIKDSIENLFCLIL